MIARWTLAMILGGILLTLLVYQNCTPVRLSRNIPSENKDLDVEFCVQPPTSEEFYRKVLFVVDKSGSNQMGGTGSDPDYQRRAGSIEAFFEEISNIDNLDFYRWGLITFGFDPVQARAYTNDGSELNPRFVGVDEMKGAIARLWNRDNNPADEDTGCTPYVEALELARTAIARDMELNPDQNVIYNVFFLSDGRPSTPNAEEKGCEEDYVYDSPDDRYLSAVRNLVNQKKESVFLSTYYYYNGGGYDGQAADGLRYMSEAGGGKFTDLGTAQRIEFEEVKVGRYTMPWKIRRFVSVNLNSGFCEDGTIDSDSDADGICDRDEEGYNDDSKMLELIKKRGLEGKLFDPIQRNSFSKNYSDLFTLQFFLKTDSGETLDCTKSKSDLDGDLLNECEEFVLFDQNANSLPGTNWFSDAIFADSQNPDSDGDGFIDVMEFFTLGYRSSSVDYSNIDRTLDGTDVRIENVLAKHMNPRDKSHKWGEDNYDPYLFERGLSDRSTYCYNFSQEHLAIYPTKAVTLNQVSENENLVHGENENVILTYYIAVPDGDQLSKGAYFYTFEKAKYGDDNKNHRVDVRKLNEYIVPDFR